MNILKIEKQIEVLSCLCEGMSIRGTERLVGVHRDTIMRLGMRTGEACKQLHDTLFKDLNVSLIQADEVWSYVGQKQKRLVNPNAPGLGDQFVFTALDPINKPILAYHVGKRDLPNTIRFIDDLREKVVNKPRVQITTDGFSSYKLAIERAFAHDVDYAMLVKNFGKEEIGIRKEVISGRPKEEFISTSLIERSNLTLRQHNRRMCRRTACHSKTLRNHKAAVALFVAHYNFCKVHMTLRTTPAMALGITDHIWSIEELMMMAAESIPTVH